MLTHLLVRDLAIVSEIALDTTGGMTALTGETGAGKSILIDALGLVLGDKADATLIRTGRERAEISAEFSLEQCPAARQWLAAQALDDEDACIIRRLLVREGRSRAFVNGRPASTNQLRELGELLVDIHGQHAHQSLLRPASQRDLLDAYAGAAAAVAAVANNYRQLRDLERRLSELEAANHERTARRELLRLQVDELTALDTSTAEIEELDQEQRRLGHLEHLRQGVGVVLQTLADAEPALTDQLRVATGTLHELATIDLALAEPRELLETASIHLDEAASTLRHYLDGLELDPAALARVEARIAAIHELARKYRVFPPQLPELLAERDAELQRLEADAHSLDDLQAACAAARAGFLAAAAALSQIRQGAAEQLAATVTAAMQQLGMRGGHFAVGLETLPPERAAASGLERVEFLVSANPGQSLQPLAKVASGGELSRISLGIQVATASCGSVPTLVFDEVDVGIGGGVAEIVGRLLRQLGDARQVLCVTHLPQVAAQAHQQLRVRKETIAGATHTRIEPLSAAERVDEIARMLGGTEITARTRDHASEMLSWTQ